MQQVYRFVKRVKPRSDNRHYHTWETAIVVVFISKDNEEEVLSYLNELLNQRKWDILESIDQSILIEDRVREVGGQVWEYYQKAMKKGYYFHECPENFAAGKKENFIVLPPRLSEVFVDRVINKAGGRRLTNEEKNYERSKNADYLLDNYVVELKENCEEALTKQGLQSNIANLFLPYFEEENEIILDYTILSEDDYKKYLDLIGRPIQNHIKDAAKQIKTTKNHLNIPDAKGCVIVINSGYGSLPHELFGSLCKHYASKDTAQIDEVFCISTKLVSNGLDSFLSLQYYPEESQTSLITKLNGIFNKELFEFMTQYIRSGCLDTGDMLPPLEPITFQRYGKIFSWLPLSMPQYYEGRMASNEE